MSLRKCGNCGNLVFRILDDKCYECYRGQDRSLTLDEKNEAVDKMFAEGCCYPPMGTIPKEVREYYVADGGPLDCLGFFWLTTIRDNYEKVIARKRKIVKI